MSQLPGLIGAFITGLVIYISYVLHDLLLLSLWFGGLAIGTFVFLYKLWKVGK